MKITTFILCVLLFVVGLYLGWRINKDDGVVDIVNPAPDTVSVFQDPDTIYVPGEIQYITKTDTVYKEATVNDSVASMDTTFQDSGKLAVDYFFRDNYFSIYRTAPPKTMITDHKTVYKAEYVDFKWYDGLGISVGYDPFMKGASVSFGYSFNIGNLKQVMK